MERMRRRGRRSHIGTRTVCGVALVVALVAGCGGDDQASTSGSPTSDDPTSAIAAGERPRLGSAHGVLNATYTFLIPQDAGAQMASGAVVDILPGSLTAKVGESIRIVNEDRQGHTVGPWYVGPHETLTQKFTSPGVFEGQCTVHSSGEFVLQVSDA